MDTAMGVHSGGEGKSIHVSCQGQHHSGPQVQTIHNKPGAMGLTKNSFHEGKDNEHLVCRGKNRLKEQATCLKSHSEISTAKMEVLGSRIRTVGWVLVQ